MTRGETDLLIRLDERVTAISQKVDDIDRRLKPIEAAAMRKTGAFSLVLAVGALAGWLAAVLSGFSKWIAGH